MSEWLELSTALSVTIGPFVDKGDGVTPETGLAGAMTVYLAKNDGTFAARGSAGAITHDRDGFYKVPLSVTDVGTLGILRLQVTDEATHLPVWENYRVVTTTEYTAAVGVGGTLYASVADLQAFKVGGKVIDLTAYSSSEMEEDLNLASRFIEATCNDVFYTESAKTFFLDGNGLTELYFFPSVVMRAISITSVQEVDVDGTTVLFTFTEDTDFKLFDYYMEMAKDVEQRPRLRVGSRGRWPQGTKNIKIVGDFGRAAVPAEIKRATILLAMERLIPGSMKITPQDVTQASWSDFTITYRGAVSVGSTTGFPDVDRLLMPHVNIVDMFLAVPDDRQSFVD